MITQDNSDCNIATINPFRYRGYYYDAEIGMYYLQSRYYDAVVGRFINSDEVEVVSINQRLFGFNQFCYCELDPVNNSDFNGALSVKQVLNILKKISEFAKKIVKWMKTFVDGILKFYTGLSHTDISAIAKDIQRSPLRVRQALQSLNKRWSKVYTRLGKIARAISIIFLVTSIAYSLTSGVEIFDIIAEYIIGGFVELVKWLLSEGLKKLISLIPAVGIFLGFVIGNIIVIVLDIIFSDGYVSKVAKKFTNIVNYKTYDAGDYFSTFFKCLV